MKEKAMFKRLTMISIVVSALSLGACGDLQELDQAESAIQAPEFLSQEQDSAVDPSGSFAFKMAADDDSGPFCEVVKCYYKVSKFIDGEPKDFCVLGNCCGVARNTCSP